MAAYVTVVRCANGCVQKQNNKIPIHISHLIIIAKAKPNTFQHVSSFDPHHTLYWCAGENEMCTQTHTHARTANAE